METVKSYGEGRATETVDKITAERRRYCIIFRGASFSADDALFIMSVRSDEWTGQSILLACLSLFCLSPSLSVPASGAN